MPHSISITPRWSGASIPTRRQTRTPRFSNSCRTSTSYLQITRRRSRCGYEQPSYSRKTLTSGMKTWRRQSWSDPRDCLEPTGLLRNSRNETRYEPCCCFRNQIKCFLDTYPDFYLFIFWDQTTCFLDTFIQIFLPSNLFRSNNMFFGYFLSRFLCFFFIFLDNENKYFLGSPYQYFGFTKTTGFKNHYWMQPQLYIHCVSDTSILRCYHCNNDEFIFRVLGSEVFFKIQVI